MGAGRGRQASPHLVHTGTRRDRSAHCPHWRALPGGRRPATQRRLRLAQVRGLVFRRSHQPLCPVRAARTSPVRRGRNQHEPIAIAVCGELATVRSQALVNTLKDARGKRACLRVTFTPLGSPVRFAADNSKTCGRGAEAGGDREPPVPPGSQSFVNSQLVTFTVVGGALFWIPNRDQLRLLVGGDDPWQRVQRISTSQVRRYRDMPVDGTLFQEVSNSRAYYVSAGHCWYVSAEQFRRRGFKSEKIRKVPDGGLRQCPYAGDLPPLAVTKAPLSPPRTSRVSA